LDRLHLPEREKIGRKAKNALGVEETLVLEKRFWRHFDWLNKQGIDMSLWTQEADICSLGKQSFASWDMAVSLLLKKDEQKRYFLGLDCPFSISPDGYRFREETSVSEIQIYERLPADNEIIERKYKSAIGVDVPIEMPGKYWRHLDWVCQYDGEKLAQEWVTYADFDHSTPNRTLSEKLKILLSMQEENYYLDYMGNSELELPLHLCPIGYFSGLTEHRSKRIYLDSDGNPISIELPRSHWNHFDWLDSIDVDGKEFVRQTHAVYKLTQYDQPFAYVMRAALLQDFKERIAAETTAEKPTTLFSGISDVAH
jgi:hypothetical protein